MGKKNIDPVSDPAIPLHDLGLADDPTDPNHPGIPDVPSDGSVGVMIEVTE